KLAIMYAAPAALVKAAIGKPFIATNSRAPRVPLRSAFMSFRTNRATANARRLLLCHLAADFAALVGVGVHVHVPFSGQQIRRLAVVERSRALERSRFRADRNGDAAILTSLAGVKMRRRRGSAQSRISAFPRQFLGVRIVGRRQGAGSLAGIR